MGSANVIQAIADNQPDCKLMFSSTSEVYGDIGMDGRKIKSNDMFFPATLWREQSSHGPVPAGRFTNKKVRGFITRAFSHTGPGGAVRIRLHWTRTNWPG